MIDDELKHKGHDLFLALGTYNDSKQPAIFLFDKEDNLRYCTATVNVPEAELEGWEVIIKNWSENEGISEMLQEAGVTKDTGKRVPCGFTQGEVHEFIASPDLFEKV